MAKVLFVCLGNICRSPLGEAIFRRQCEEAGLDHFTDSAGTGNWHVGQFADPRSIKVGEQRGCKMTMRARQIRAEDFERFDVIIAMDRNNAHDLKHWPGAKSEKVHLMRSFDPAAKGKDVPDPYYGEHKDFEEVADMLETACAGLLAHLREKVQS